MWDYGLWGDYVLSGATLDDALRRTRSALCYHSSYDQVEVIPRGDQVWFSYLFAESHGKDYENIAFIALAVMLSIARGYFGENSTPPVAELNIPCRRCMS